MTFSSLRTYRLPSSIAEELAGFLPPSIGSVDVRPLTFDQDFDSSESGCVLTSLSPDTSKATELLEELERRKSSLTVVYLLERPAAKVVVELMRKGAVDVLDWPLDRERIGETIERASLVSVEKRRGLAEAGEARRRLEVLSPSEAEVLQLMLGGLANKTIGKRLGIALRTVEARRKRALEKMGTRSLAEIAGVLNRAKLLSANGALISRAGDPKADSP